MRLFWRIAFTRKKLWVPFISQNSWSCSIAFLIELRDLLLRSHLCFWRTQFAVKNECPLLSFLGAGFPSITPTMDHHLHHQASQIGVCVEFQVILYFHARGFRSSFEWTGSVNLSKSTKLNWPLCETFLCQTEPSSGYNCIRMKRPSFVILIIAGLCRYLPKFLWRSTQISSFYFISENWVFYEVG